MTTKGFELTPRDRQRGKKHGWIENANSNDALARLKDGKNGECSEA